MEIANVPMVAAFATLVVVPLAREYVDFRRAWGFSRLAALGTTLVVVPAFGLGITLGLPLSSRPPLQWTVTVLVTLLAYSLVASAVRGASSPVEVPTHSG